MEETQMVVKKESGDDHQMKEEKSSPSIKLGLGIGGVDEVGGGGGGVGNKRCCGLFTAVQLHELEQQALIYKHIAAALPVPLNLLVPIWKSVVTSFGSANGAAAIYKQYPSFIGFSPLGFEYRNAMDPEPGRCRRTDGKKWRCGKSVVPDQKYCQQHMHRGRNRSRKPVEASEIASPPDTKTPKNSEGEKWNSKTNLQISTPKGLQFMAQSSNDIRVSPGTTTTSSSYQECKKNISSVTSVTATPITNTLTNRTAKAPAAAATTTAATTAISNKNNLNIGVKDNSSNNAGDSYCIIRRSSNNRNHINVGTNISPGTPGLGFSPKSVLQGRRAILLGCNGLCFDNRSGIEPEPGRCRRTDGKKWRCRRDVLLDQKYCDRHIHRGAKQMKTSQPVAVPSASAAAMNTAQLSQTTAIPTAIPRRTDCATPNTNLTISIPASPPPIQDDEKSNPSSDSDTTITDTSLTAHEHSYVSS